MIGGIIVNKEDSFTKDIIKFYGDFIPVPTKLLVDPKYNGKGSGDRISHNSAILYGVLLRLSKRKNEKDESGYITITNEEIATIIGTTTGETVLRMINQLIKFELIEREPFKHGKAYRLKVNEI